MRVIHGVPEVEQSWSGMSGVSLPVSRPIGRALIVANPAGRADLLSTMGRLGYGATELDDPYAAMVELCRRPLAYRAVVLSLAGLYREELNVMPAIKRRFPHIEIWLSHTDGRQGALADAMRLGADGLLAEDGLHRLAMGPASLTAPTPGESAGSEVGGKAPGGGEANDLEPHRTTESTFAGATEITAGEAVGVVIEPVEPRDRGLGPSEAGGGSADVSGVFGTGHEHEPANGEPVLTADELRALLHEQSSSAPPEDS